MKFVITGAAGLVGKALTLRLAAEGHQVVAACRSHVPEVFLSHTNISTEQGHLADEDYLRRILKGADGVFHVAAFAKPWHRDKEEYQRVNVDGTRAVSEACVTAGVKRLVLTSSAGIHGPQKGDVLVNESHWPDLYHTEYEQSKFDAQQVALSFQERGLEVTIVSPARVYAPGAASESNVPVRMFQMYVRNKFGFVPADGSGIGSYVFIDDVVTGHVLAMLSAPSGEEYLLGGDNRTYLELFSVFADVIGKKHPIIKIPYALSLGIGKAQLFAAETFGLTPTITTPWVRRYLLNWGIDSAKIQALGYRPTALETGMEKVAASLPGAIRLRG